MSIINDSFMKTRDFINTFKTTKIMKTGGTMNFLKRAGAILMVVAIFASSCNKYADDFKQLNTKLDALATQVAGVTQLTTDLASVKTSVAAIQASVAALPNPTAAITKLQTDLTTTLANIATINTNLNALALAAASKTDVTNAIATITTNVKTELTSQLATVNANIAAAVASMKADNTAQNTAINTEIVANNTALAALIQAQITAMQSALTGSGTDATAVTVKGLQLLLTAQQTALNQLLANSNFFAGNVNITSDAEVAFYLTKIGTWIGGGMISGNVTVTTTNISVSKRADLKTITDNIIAVIANGLNAGDLTITTSAGDALSFAKLASLAGSVAVTTKAAVNEVSFPVLATVGGNYSVTGFDIADAALATVTGTLTADYDGGYAYPALTSVANVVLNDYITSAVAGNLATGTMAIDFSGLTTNTTFQTAATAIGFRGQVGVIGLVANTAVFSSAATVVIGAGNKLVGLVANAANTVTLNASATATYPASLAVSATKAASAITVGGKIVTTNLTIGGSATSTVTLPNLVSVGGTTSITAGTLTASALTTLTGAATLASVTPVNLPALATAPAGLSATAAVTFTAPLYNVDAAGGLTLGAPATTLEVASVAGGNIGGTGAAFVTLKVDVLNEALTIPGTVVTATVNGIPAIAVPMVTPAVVNAGGATLKTLTLGGMTGSVIKTANVSSSALTALTTAGVINSLNVSGTALVGMTLAHTHYVGGPGSTLSVTGNTLLTTLSSGVLDYPLNINIVGNGALASLDLSSYHTPLLAAALATTTITIGGSGAVSNKLTGNYTNAVAVTATTPYVESTITSAALHSLKAFVAMYKVTPAWPQISLNCNVDLVTLGGVVGNLTLDSRLSTDRGANHTVANGAPFALAGSATGITTMNEFTLVQ